MTYLRTIEAARLLDVTPNTLREWERRFGFPASHPSPTGSREFVFDEVIALRDALQQGMSISSGVSQARSALASVNADSLFAGFVTLDGGRCGRLIEASLKFRSLEGVLEDVLVRALDLVARTHGHHSAPWAFAADFASDWMRDTIQDQRGPVGTGSILLANTSRDDYDRDAVYILALELACRLAGFDVQALPVGSTEIRRARPLAFPSVLVIAGDEIPDEIVDDWGYATRSTLKCTHVAVYRRDPRGLPQLSPIAELLPDGPSAARQLLVELAEERLYSTRSEQQLGQ